MTFRYVAEISYDGGAFFGFQRQGSLLTVQGALEDALSVLAKGQVRCVGAGRTDKGVHARGQVVHFDMPSPWDPHRLRLAIKGSLPPGIEVMRVSEAPPGFHARYGAVFREYRYFVWNAPWRYPHLCGVTWHVRGPLDHRRLGRLAELILGERDFRAFCRSSDRPRNTVRRMMTASVKRKGPLLVFTFRADGFLTNMVRILVGTMVEVDRGMMSEEEFVGLFDGKDRSMSGRTAPPEGLFFWRVHYEPSPWSFG